MTLVTFAVGFESEPFRRMVENRQDIRIVLTGMGPDAARQAVSAELARTPLPTRVISAGLAGALDPDLRVGDVILAENFTTVSSIPNSLRKAKLVTCDQIVSTAHAKAALRLAGGADAVDMETEAVWEVCRHYGVELLAIRAISDDANTDMPVPPDVLEAAGKSVAGTLRLVATLAKHPKNIPAFTTLVSGSNQARNALAQAIVEIL